MSKGPSWTPPERTGSWHDRSPPPIWPGHQYRLLSVALCSSNSFPPSPQKETMTIVWFYTNTFGLLCIFCSISHFICYLPRTSWVNITAFYQSTTECHRKLVRKATHLSTEITHVQKTLVLICTVQHKEI